MPLIELRAVTKFYGATGLDSRRREARSLLHSFSGIVPSDRRPVLRETDLVIEKGRSLGILGRSGAGKSTLGKIICGLEAPTSGSVYVCGRADNPGSGDSSMTGHTQALPRQVPAIARKERAVTAQMIWQDAPGSLDPRMRIAGIIAEPLLIHKLVDGKEERRATVARLMEEVGLPAALAGRYPHEISGGEAQRVVIARALALDPPLLVCDEPASALDMMTRTQIADLLAGLHRERQTALVVIAHDLALIRRLTQWLVVFHEGMIVEEGPTASVLAAPRHQATKMIVEAEPAWPPHAT